MSRLEKKVVTVVQRPLDIAPKNTENESRKLHAEYTPGNEYLVFNLQTKANFALKPETFSFTKLFSLEKSMKL
jgi:hypothetical protein